MNWIAGEEGIEPSMEESEPSALPLGYSPKKRAVTDFSLIEIIKKSVTPRTCQERILCFAHLVGSRVTGLSQNPHAVSGSIPGVHRVRFQGLPLGKQWTQSPVGLSRIETPVKES